MSNTVRILGSRAREQVPGTSITLLAPGFRGALTQLTTDDSPGGTHLLPFARAATGAELMLAANLSMHLEPRPPENGPGLRTLSAVSGHPRIIVPKRNGVAYALLQTDEYGVSSFVLPESRDASETVFPLSLCANGATHRALRVLVWSAQLVAGHGALTVVSRWERLRRPYRLQQLGEQGWQPPDWPMLTCGPILLLLHGTFGTPQATFADWLESESYQVVARRYQGRCLAFAHPTLGSNPDENLAWLLAQLPPLTTQIDIVAHGRGGLLARGIAAEGRLSVRRVCQIGTPNNGTPLAAQANLPCFLNGHVAQLARLPQVVAEATLEGALCMVRFVALGLPADLPGLESIAPESQLLRALGAFHVSPQEWFTVGAQFETRCDTDESTKPEDAFSSPNDLVVPSAGCHEPGAAPIDSLRLAGMDVHHHNYFADRQVRERLATWLQ
jgi:pimeloyl-ACP methyl ester carboxylesterase